MASADKLRANMDAAECKHLVLGMIFLKHISERDTLLPRLISSQLWLPDAEAELCKELP